MNGSLAYAFFSCQVSPPPQTHSHTHKTKTSYELDGERYKSENVCKSMNWSGNVLKSENVYSDNGLSENARSENTRGAV